MSAEYAKQFHADLVEAGHPHAAVGAVLGAFTIPQIIKLMVFAAEYGPKLFEVATAVYKVVKAPGGLTPAAIIALIKEYGKPVYNMIVMIAGFFGVTVPPLPAA